MQNSVVVRKRDRARKLRDKCRCLARFVAIIVDSRRERPAFRELHAIKRRAIMLANRVNRENAVVLKARCCFCFGTETADRA